MAPKFFTGETDCRFGDLHGKHTLQNPSPLSDPIDIDAVQTCTSMGVMGKRAPA